MRLARKALILGATAVMACSGAVAQQTQGVTGGQVSYDFNGTVCLIGDRLNPVCNVSSTGASANTAAQVALLSEQTKYLYQIMISLQQMNGKLDTTSNSVIAAKDSIVAVNQGFNQQVINLIQAKFAQLPKEIQATDVYQNLRKDILKEVELMLKSREQSGPASSPSNTTKTPQNPSPGK